VVGAVAAVASEVMDEDAVVATAVRAALLAADAMKSHKLLQRHHVGRVEHTLRFSSHLPMRTVP
jgi:hypothetical protein